MFESSEALLINASMPFSLLYIARALLSRGKQGPPKPKPYLRFFSPILESEPIAFKIVVGLAFYAMAMSPIIFAYAIFVVKKQFKAIFVISASFLDM